MATDTKQRRLTTAVNEDAEPPPETNLTRIGEIVSDCSLEVIEAMGQLEQVLKLASGVRQLRELITDRMMADIMQLHGTRLGFRTDKDNVGGTYGVEVVKECVIEAMLRGVRPVGNEFNIIAGNMYITKEGCTRLVREFPGLTDLVLNPGVPAGRDGGALVAFSASWKVDGVPQRLDCVATDDSDTRIPVRQNKQMGQDAVIGKATRKMLARIYAQLTGSMATPDGEVDDAPPAATTHVIDGEVAATDLTQPQLAKEK